MTEKKKRGLLSWLGFGDEEQTKDTPKSEQQDETRSVQESPAEADITAETEIAVESDRAGPENAELVEQKTEETSIQDTSLNEVQDIELAVEVDPPVLAEAEAEAEAEEVRIEEQEKPTESFFARLKRSLSRTKANIGAGFFGLFKGKQIDDELFEELEEQLLIADVGMTTTVKIIDSLTEKASRQDLKDGEALYGLLKEEMSEILSTVDKPLEVDTTKTPYVILMVGVNGVGKTTTIGKLAKQFQNEGKKVMLAAGDTFRAAAVEQLQVWGERNNVPVIAQHTGADSASVIYDAIEAAKARGVDVVIADTAGRLQNKANLMEELRKIVRVMKKIDDSAPHEIMLTLDAGTGQNAISQAKLFSDVAPVTGITLTKLDGTAKGGVIFAIADQFQIPIRYIGVGEGIDDLRPFKTEEFVEALFSREE
ncbi:signal recognition particle-docking protein FtsY [Vibrio genomosp. F10]|uniref:signal recognition particle-docking protein FtsY n=1 Tax=Vibrio genomosp. F10 TaxID=723171 RepID=UPI0002FEDD81|nr:signal recognition particle-docking protein FtsY [Vibrio genomosp. F10]OEF04228.1 signal recognition particle-docking protein FtsY [Vibrio genomosp. F10 str. 9ZB36]OEF04451.1 signal recognition particle-docking protein FtsY [Vibrio genomosp. F10 str. 9ZD137]